MMVDCGGQDQSAASSIAPFRYAFHRLQETHVAEDIEREGVGVRERLF
jgi:hypothetical protein